MIIHGCFFEIYLVSTCNIISFSLHNQSFLILLLIVYFGLVVLFAEAVFQGEHWEKDWDVHFRTW